MGIISTKRSIGLAFLLPLVLAGCNTPEERAKDYFDRGVALLAKQDDLNARIQLTTSLKFKSDNLAAWRALAPIDEKYSSPNLFGDLRRIVELDPNDLDARLKLVRIMVRAGAGEAALKVIEAANETGKPNAELHALKASILLRSKDVSGAVREAQRALEIDPVNAEATMIVAAKKADDGDTDGALKLLNGISAKDPADGLRISMQKVGLYARKGDLPQAEKLLVKLVSENPKQPAFRNQLVQFYSSGRRFDDAEKLLRSTAESNPTDDKAGIDLVQFLTTVRGPQAGRDELNKRVKAGGDVFNYQLALSELDVAQGNMAEAEQQLKGLVNGSAASDRKLLAQSKLAELYVSKANFPAAEPLIAAILKADRRNLSGLRLRAAIRIEQGQFDNAIADLREALNDQPKSTELLLLLAAAYERSGKNELADRQYADALKMSGGNPNIALRYVAFLQRRGDVSHAEDVLTDVVGRNPSNGQLLSALAQVRLARKNWAGVLAVADNMSKLGENRATVAQILASALAGQNKIEESLLALLDAHAAAPDAVQPVVSLVSTYTRLGRTDKAEALTREMLKKFPDNAQLLVLLGQTKLAQNKTDDAVQSYKTAIAKQPKDPVGYTALTDLYIRQKNYAAAGEVIQTGLREQPSNLNFRFTSAAIDMFKGDNAAAVAEYESILKDQPTSTLAINNVVSLILDSKSDKESIDRAVAMADSLKRVALPEFQDTYGWAQFKSGNFKTAVPTLEAAEAKLPDHAAVHYHLGLSYAAVGQPEKAADQFRTALALNPDDTLKANIQAAMKSN